jgi:hypothetical protein
MLLDWLWALLASNLPETDPDASQIPTGRGSRQAGESGSFSEERRMKKKLSREKAASLQEKDLAWVKGRSGYIQPDGKDGPTDPPPPGGG